jgi:DNA mismatch endonuclease (patch repair protein)
MRAVKSKNTKPELIVRKSLFALGFRYRIHDTKLLRKPDIVFPKYKAVIFVHGCFWHGHSCYLCRKPKSRTDYWNPKIKTNKLQDQSVVEELLSQGWRVELVWECALSKKIYSELFETLSLWLHSDESFIELQDSRNYNF